MEDYIHLFFPFGKPDLKSTEDENRFSTDDKHEVALFLTYDGYPQAQVMSFLRDYGERYEWQAKVCAGMDAGFLIRRLVVN